VKAPAEFAVFGCAPLALPASAAPAVRMDARPPVHPPPGGILHEFCILLI
jgi:hypothetical protein